MKSSSLIIVASGLLIALAACEQGSGVKPEAGRNRFGYRGTVENADNTQFATPTPTPDPYATPTPPPVQDIAPTPTPMPTPSTTGAGRDIAYGTPVPGKPGFVTSPHSPYAGYVDVRGFPPGTEVKCPYSGKIFLVP